MASSTPDLSALSGPTYVTAQSLVQQVAYVLSDKIFAYSPESFDLDAALKQWASSHASNAHGETPSVNSMETRQGAGNIALGYLFSQDFDLKKRHIPQGIVASSATLPYMRAALEQLSLLYSVANPVAAHIAAVDYAGDDGLVSDYATALSLAEDLGFGLVSSASVHEAQHMALFTTLLASVLPSVHIYDGVRVGRENTRVIDVLDKSGLSQTFETVRKTLEDARSRHLDAEGKVMDVLQSLNGELGTDYSLFEYHGHEKPTSVLVSFGTVEGSLTAQVADALAKAGTRVGVINVRVYRPFVEEEFLRVLPQSTRVVGVLGQVANQQAVQEPGIRSALYEDVFAALTFASGREHSPSCIDIKYPRSQTWDIVNTAAAFQLVFDKPVLHQSSNANSGPAQLQLLDPGIVQEYTFWDVDDSASSEAAATIGQALTADSASNVVTHKTLDNLVQGGTVRFDIRKSSKTLNAPYAVTAADTAYVGELKLLGDIDITASVKNNGKVIVNAPGVKDDELEKKLPACFRQSVAQRGISVFLVDPSATGDASLDSSVMQAAFMSVALPQNELASKRLSSIVSNPGALETLTKDVNKVLRQIEIPETWKTLEEPEISPLPMDISANSFLPFDKNDAEPPSLLKDWQTAAKGLAFKEAFNTKTSLRPDTAAKTYTVRVKENRRLTPVTYDRNIFHIEFDLGDSGLTYDIGEALGVHAENDPKEVSEFIDFYGLNPDDVVEVPSREDAEVLENRTVYQALVQNVDLFGRPPKRFYEALSEYATDEKERDELRTLGGPEGAVEFKRRSEVDTVTYADILLGCPSAHPDFHDLIKIVSPLKRREYSIASCQKVTPTSVALMIVVINWVDPRGRDRFGLATRYLNRLQPGDPVTVSVKPSVMKLPAKATQPLIMAGLGTGLAPFRAFVQHRALEKAQGKEIGSVLLYMGSRHQREEYCYGEEWEAYQDAGVITLLGRAFSRDQPQKIYIQDRMRQTLPDITKAYLQEEGAFYLCGPTWPVPDVTAVLEEAIAAQAKSVGKRVETRKEIEKLKDGERYVLEVY